MGCSGSREALDGVEIQYLCAHQGAPTRAARRILLEGVVQRQVGFSSTPNVDGALVVRRQERVRIRGALHLRDFHQGFVAHAQVCAGGSVLHLEITPLPACGRTARCPYYAVPTNGRNCDADA